MVILAIDPGCLESAYVLYGSRSKKIYKFGKIKNDELMAAIETFTPDVVLLEMIASYGMPVGREVFETVLWIGRFFQKLITKSPKLVYRKEIKVHHCGTTKAKDGNIIQSLKDKYGDKGTKSNPGFFFGFSADVWQAFALCAYYVETVKTDHNQLTSAHAGEHL